MNIGIIAPSSRIPQVELGLGVKALEAEGFDVQVHRQCRGRYLFFAGDDRARAEAFYEMAMNPEIPILWAARGGSGVIRMLPHLDRLVEERGSPPFPKLYVGYSDSTPLMDYVRVRFGWNVIHGPMPSLRTFSQIERKQWGALVSLLRGARPPQAPWRRLKFMTERPAKAIEGELVGGNLTVWASVVGTPYFFRSESKLIFLEDVDEAAFRLDRVIQQLLLAGAFEGARGIVLGDFTNCRDVAPQVLKKAPKNPKGLTQPSTKDLMPLRPLIPLPKVLRELFGSLGECLKIPVAYGLPAGHGPGFAPLAMGGTYRLQPDGQFELKDWNWLSQGG